MGEEKEKEGRALRGGVEISREGCEEAFGSGGGRMHGASEVRRGL